MNKLLKVLAFGLVLLLASCVEDDVEEFTIYYKDYDETVIESNDYLVGETIEESIQPTREGYTFVGWDIELPEEMPADDITCNAVYDINSYSLTFLDYDESLIETIEVEYGVNIVFDNPTNITREGYTFTGWDSEVPNVMPANDIIINAEYDINSYSLSYVDYDGSLIKTIEVEYGANITSESPEDGIREGYTFLGWDNEILDVMPAEDLTYQATYMVNQLTISFETDNGSDVEAIVQNYGSTVIAPTDPTKENYVFVGWYTDTSFTESFIFTTMPSNNVTIYAKWVTPFYYDINNYVENLGFNGSLLIYLDGENLLDEGYGWANVAESIENTPETRFLIGSITKQFTAVAIMMLYEDELINFKDTVDMYIPDFPNGDIITIHNLLTHTSGLENYLIHIPRDSEYLESYHTPLSLIDIIRDYPLEFQPGSAFEYSNTNYLILGYIIEQISGITYQEFMQQNIFTPLEMNNTGFSLLTPGPNDALSYYEEFVDSSSTVLEFRHPSISYSSGSMISTTGDLLIWHHALMNYTLISESTTGLLYQPYTEPVYGFDGYGYGWYVLLTPFAEPRVFHSGDSQHSITYFYRNTGSDLAIIMTSNEYRDVQDLILYYIFDMLVYYGY